MIRCNWVNTKNKQYIEYHDIQWWVKLHKDNELFEMLILEWAQAWLSWETILKKRENYKKAFDNFDPKKVAKYDEKKQTELIQNERIIRNKLKIKSTIINAKVFLEIQKEFWSFDKYILSFTNWKTIKNKYKTSNYIPTKTKLSEMISKDLKKRGMNFVWPTIIYAFMQAIWIINNHEVSCFRYNQI
jgi:DNA-3-methyladenine glycosylase I